VKNHFWKPTDKTSFTTKRAS